MGYENVNPSTLQTLLGSPPVPVYDGSPVGAAQGVNVGRGGSAGAVSPRTVHKGDLFDGMLIGPSSSLSQLISTFGKNLEQMRFGSAADNLSELGRHLAAGLEHWEMFVKGYQ